MFISSCIDIDPQKPNEEELITTVIYTLISSDTKDTIVLSFRDIDGIGGNQPIIKNGILKKNSTYTGFIIFKNESVTPDKNVNFDILMEDEQHQIFYQDLSNAGIKVIYKDKDSEGKPVGLYTELSTLENSGKLNIILRHEPNKNGINVSSGDIRNAGGETDIEISFDVEVR